LKVPTGQFCNAEGEWKPLEVEGPGLSARAYLAVETVDQDLFIFGGYKPDTMTSSNSMYQLTKIADPEEEAERASASAAQPVKGIRFDQRVVVAGGDGTSHKEANPNPNPNPNPNWY